MEPPNKRLLLFLHPIKSTEIGKESPRAYIDYEHTKTPDPGYFKQILQNSVDKQEMVHFCEYYIRLLNCGNKQHKERVMCLVGEPNRGKTSLFTPITRFIPARYIAMTSKQKAFNKSLVDENTPIIFLDQAYAKLMDPDDWKILTQGGLTAHDRKYKVSSLAAIRCPMFITCQMDMDFGPEHNGAMAVRLRKFFLLDITACSGSTRILANPCNELYCLGMQPGDHSRRRVTTTHAWDQCTAR